MSEDADLHAEAGAKEKGSAAADDIGGGGGMPPSTGGADSPASVAFLVTFITLLLAVVVLLVTTRSRELPSFDILGIAAVSIAVAILYLTVRLMVHRFIQHRLDAVFRIVDKATTAKTAGSITNVEEQVEKWAAEKDKEIESLKTTAKWRKEFLGNISHELKTPVFNIQGLILTLLDGGLEDSSINRLYLQRSEKSINRLISIIEDLQVISRMESEEKMLRKSTFSMRHLAAEVVEANEVRARAASISLFVAAGSKPYMINADREQIYRVLTNLVSNAISYGIRGGYIRISFSSMPGKVITEVTDNGIGIEAEHLPRLFERFYRVEKHRSRESGGTGLGLAIVKHIVEAHGHTVMVKSKPAEGTTFAFPMTAAGN